MNMSCKYVNLFIMVALLVVSLPMAVRAQAPVNVSPGELTGFTLVFDLDIPDDLDTDATGSPPYTTDNSGSILPGTFDRIAYYLELDDGNGLQFVWVSMDAFTTDPTQIGVPTQASGAFFQTTVANMNVESNVGSIVTGTGIATGNIEFWPFNYITSAGLGGIPTGNNLLYDFNDTSTDVNNYGSMQIHNYGAGQTLLAYNDWGGNPSLPVDDLGIGNSTVANTVDGKVHRDWTFLQNADTYTTKRLQVYVRTGNQNPVLAADGPAEADEGDLAESTGTVSDPDGDTVTLSASIGNVVNNNDGTWSWSFTTSDGPAETQTVTIDADDNNGGTAQTTFTLTVNNVAPTVDAITVPGVPIDINSQPVTGVSATFSDPASTDDEPYTCTVDYDDGNGAQPGTVVGTTCTGPSQTYAEPGVYAVTVTVTDKDNDSGSATATEFIVIYDPAGGFVTGAGSIDSPAGAYLAEPSLSGKASFGFLSKYQKGSSVPGGQTQFQFKTAALKFESDSYDWLVIAGAKAMYKGDGTINDAGNYGFQLTAVDESLTPSTSADLFRIRIWDKDNNDQLVYDNEVGETDPNAEPTTQISTGNIKIHQAAAAKSTANDAGQTTDIPKTYALGQNYPNPFNPTTTINFQLPEQGDVELRIFNTLGQEVRTLADRNYEAGFHSVNWNGKDNFGSAVPSGTYFYRIKAGSFIKVRKMSLVK